MQLRSNEFKARAAANLGDAKLQKGLGLIKVKAVVNRASAVAEFGDFETLREAGKEIRNRALADLDLYLERFEREATARAPWCTGRRTPPRPAASSSTSRNRTASGPSPSRSRW